MEIQGRIIAVMPERSGTSARGEWKVQEYVLETMGTQYPRKMAFEVFGADRIQRFNIQPGQDVLVAFDIDAREYNGRWYNSIRAFDVRPAAGAQPVAASPEPFAQPAAPVAEQPAASPAAPFATDDNGSTDNLPF